MVPELRELETFGSLVSKPYRLQENLSRVQAYGITRVAVLL